MMKKVKCMNLILICVRILFCLLYLDLSVFLSYAGRVSLGMIMIFFFLGADDIPPIGYIHAPVINFNPNSLYPTSSTCALQLTLPTCSSEYKPLF